MKKFISGPFSAVAAIVLFLALAVIVVLQAVSLDELKSEVLALQAFKSKAEVLQGENEAIRLKLADYLEAQGAAGQKVFEYSNAERDRISKTCDANYKKSLEYIQNTQKALKLFMEGHLEEHH
jgi:hypothetical protein